MPDLISPVAIPKEKLLFRVFSRTLGLITSHTYESQEELLNKFFPDRSVLIHYSGVDELDQPVEHYFDRRTVNESGDIFGLVFVPMKDRKVLPVQTQIAEGPARKIH